MRYLSTSRILYTEEPNLQSVEQAQKLYYAANKYEVPAVEQACTEYLLKSCYKSDLHEMRAFGEMFSLKEIIDLCTLVSVLFFFTVFLAFGHWKFSYS